MQLMTQRVVINNKNMKFKFLTSFLLLTLLLIPLTASAYLGKCVGVLNGDMILVTYKGEVVQIKFDGIDCPEEEQPFGEKAKQFTYEKVSKKVVKILPTTEDRYGRTVARVYVDGKELNAALVGAGLAWHNKQYSDDKNLALLEQNARREKIGLWSDSNPIPPWEWRRGVRGTTVTEEQAPRSPPPPTPTITPSIKTKESIIYHGNTQTHKFHRPGCRYYNCKNCTAVFHSREEAINAGYKPCKVCNP